jgi:acyl dehydratase
MADELEITEEMRAQIGTESPPWTYEVTTTSVRAFARGVGYTDPVYYDVDQARKAGYPNLPAPPCYLGTPVFIPGRSSDTFSGPMQTSGRLNIPLKGLLDGGTETEYLEGICAGDTLTAVQKLANLEVRESRSLGKMLIVTNETTYKNQHGNVVATPRSQAIFY